jgi:hypothetical protein
MGKPEDDPVIIRNPHEPRSVTFLREFTRIMDSRIDRVEKNARSTHSDAKITFLKLLIVAVENSLSNTPTSNAAIIDLTQLNGLTGDPDVDCTQWFETTFLTHSTSLVRNNPDDPDRYQNIRLFKVFNTQLIFQRTDDGNKHLIMEIPLDKLQRPAGLSVQPVI